MYGVYDLSGNRALTRTLIRCRDLLKLRITEQNRQGNDYHLETSYLDIILIHVMFRFVPWFQHLNFCMCEILARINPNFLGNCDMRCGKLKRKFDVRHKNLMYWCCRIMLCFVEKFKWLIPSRVPCSLSFAIRESSKFHKFRLTWITGQYFTTQRCGRGKMVETMPHTGDSFSEALFCAFTEQYIAPLLM